MYHADRWAAAFISALDNKAEAGLVCLKNLADLLKPIRGVLFGRSIANSIDEMMSAEFIKQKDNSLGGIIEHEYPIRFVCLLIEKNLFRNIDSIIAKIDSMLDEKNNVLNVVVETASDENKGNAFENELTQMIKESMGSDHVKMSITVVPELLAGFRLRMNGHYIDASLKGQLEQMTADLMKVGQKEHEDVAI